MQTLNQIDEASFHTLSLFFFISTDYYHSLGCGRFFKAVSKIFHIFPLCWNFKETISKPTTGDSNCLNYLPTVLSSQFSMSSMGRTNVVKYCQ